MKVITDGRTVNVNDADALKRHLQDNCPGVCFLQLDGQGSDAKALPPIPETVRDLQVIGFPRLIELTLPPNLIKLLVSGCTGLASLAGDLPALLEELRILNCTLSLAGDLPALLEELRILNCTLKFGLPDLPPSLRLLWLEQVYGLKAFGPLGASLQDLRVTECVDFNGPLDLQETCLHTLVLKGLPGLKNLSGLPDGLTVLRIEELSDKLTELPQIPASAAIVSIQKLLGLTRLPKFPSGLVFLEVTGCKALEEGRVLEIVGVSGGVSGVMLGDVSVYLLGSANMLAPAGAM